MQFRIDSIDIGDSTYDRYPRDKSTDDFIWELPNIEPRDTSWVSVRFCAGEDLETEVSLSFEYGYLGTTNWHGKDITQNLIEILDRKNILEHDCGQVSIREGKLADLIREIEKLTTADVFCMG